MGKKIIVENRMAHQIKAILLRLFLARILRPEINAITFWF
jgi:hypothetical protein